MTGWRPGTVKLVAGALPYTQYAWFKRLIMKRIVGKAGGDTDTTGAIVGALVGATAGAGALSAELWTPSGFEVRLQSPGPGAAERIGGARRFSGSQKTR